MLCSDDQSGQFVQTDKWHVIQLLAMEASVDLNSLCHWYSFVRCRKLTHLILLHWPFRMSRVFSSVRELRLCRSDSVSNV